MTRHLACPCAHALQWLLQCPQSLPCMPAPQVPTWKLQEVYSLKHLPAEVRPARPARWLALALDTGVTISDSMPAGVMCRGCGGQGCGGWRDVGAVSIQRSMRASAVPGDLETVTSIRGPMGHAAGSAGTHKLSYCAQQPVAHMPQRGPHLCAGCSCSAWQSPGQSRT